MKVYQKTWFIILMFVLVWTAPVGVYLMWKYKKDWGKKLKIGISAVFGVFAALLVVSFAAGGSEAIKEENSSYSSNNSSIINSDDKTTTRSSYITSRTETDPTSSEQGEPATTTVTITTKEEPTTTSVTSATAKVTTTTARSLAAAFTQKPASSTTKKTTSATTKKTTAATTKKTTTTTRSSSAPIKITTSLVFRRNENATVGITGKPNTTYSISVYYSSGASKAEGLKSKTSDSNGNVSWTWHIGGNTNPGKYRLKITGDGETITREFTVIAD